MRAILSFLAYQAVSGLPQLQRFLLDRCAFILTNRVGFRILLRSDGRDLTDTFYVKNVARAMSVQRGLVNFIDNNVVDLKAIHFATDDFNNGVTESAAIG